MGGNELTSAALRDLRNAEAQHRALAFALRLLSYRQRSEAELRGRLAQKAIRAAVIEETIGRLRGAGLLNDEEFARSWVDRRDRTSPRSRRLMSSELRAKGVDARLAEQSVAGADDEDAAYRAARRARSRQALPYLEFSRRLASFLLRRGFEYEVINRVVARLWEETTEEPPAMELYLGRRQSPSRYMLQLLTRLRRFRDNFLDTSTAATVRLR